MLNIACATVQYRNAMLNVDNLDKYYKETSTCYKDNVAIQSWYKLDVDFEWPQSIVKLLDSFPDRILESARQSILEDRNVARIFVFFFSM